MLPAIRCSQITKDLLRDNQSLNDPEARAPRKHLQSGHLHSATEDEKLQREIRRRAARTAEARKGSPREGHLSPLMYEPDFGDRSCSRYGPLRSDNLSTATPRCGSSRQQWLPPEGRRARFLTCSCHCLHLLSVRSVSLPWWGGQVKGARARLVVMEASDWWRSQGLDQDSTPTSDEPKHPPRDTGGSRPHKWCSWAVAKPLASAPSTAP